MYRDRSLRLPLDGRLGIIFAWLLAFTLLLLDTRDGRFGIDGAWGIFFAIAASCWTSTVLHAYSRRVVLEVMSWEHAQQMNPGDDDRVAFLRPTGD